MYFLSTGTALMERLLKNAKVAGCFGLLCHEVIDISLLELLITFIQFFEFQDRQSGNTFLVC